MRIIGKIIFFLFFALLLGYVLLPNPNFPEPMSDFIESHEPADIETPFRRGYYTNATREEVMNYYLLEFQKPTFGGIPFLSYRLNYPPEEAQVRVRDQTKSTFLEEIVHPLRESLYINGFEPTTPEYQIVLDGVHWRQKIIIRYVSGTAVVRALVVFLTGVMTFILGKEIFKW